MHANPKYTGVMSVILLWFYTISLISHNCADLVKIIFYYSASQNRGNLLLTQLQLYKFEASLPPVLIS